MIKRKIFGELSSHPPTKRAWLLRLGHPVADCKTIAITPTTAADAILEGGYSEPTLGPASLLVGGGIGEIIGPQTLNHATATKPQRLVHLLG